MLLTFLLALTLGPEAPLAPLRTGSPAQSVRSIVGPAPTANGGWLMAWNDGTTITIAPVGADGQPSDVRRQLAGGDAAIASTARGPILLWTASGGVFAAPLAADGSIAGPATRVAAPASKPLIACNATRCLATANKTIAILDADANILSSTSSPDRPAFVAADPNGFLVLSAPPPGDTLVAQRLDQTGAVTMTATAGTPFVAADFDGERYVLVYESKDHPNLVAVKLALDGTLSQPSTIYTPRIGAMYGVSIAWNGSEHLVAVSDITELGVGIEGTIWPSVIETLRLDRNLAPLAPSATLFGTPRSNLSPRVASAGGRFFVGWQHFGLGASVRAAQVVNGNVTHSIFTLGPLSQLSPAIAAADERDLVLWLDRDDATGKVTLFDRRLPQDAEARVLAEAYDIKQPAAASIGSDWLAVWTETPTTNVDLYEVKGAIVSPFSDSVQRISIGVRGRLAGIAAGANGWVLLIHTIGNVDAVRVTRAGQVMPVVHVSASGANAAIASNGANFLCAVGAGDSVLLALLDANGQVSATGRISAPNSYAVAVASSRREFIVAAGGNEAATSFWRVGNDLNNAVLTGRASALDQLPTLIPFGTGLLAALGTSAIRLDASGVPIGAPTVFPNAVQAIAPHGTKAVAVFGRKIPALPVDAQQLFVREITDPDNGRRRVLR